MPAASADFAQVHPFGGPKVMVDAGEAKVGGRQTGSPSRE